MRYTEHVCRFLRENIYIVHQEPSEGVFQFTIQVGLDESRLSRIIVDQLDLLVFFDLENFLWNLQFGNLELIKRGLACLNHGLRYLD
jgi:hypothetical protein